ncbi:MAG: hypothetical protein COV74_09635 [Candidatus Omnitrophica bacterium CG11_big_fil_rev_8_21_14_0_20_45_26]|uniref:Uncharacterized protein n=1 Tax=Candidatus Abzuiibacterium crystallinum TaxID=1974748 RepID=A0A2H0LLC8_9BACT|nr:MAG: hypothetical protein COV74_09635 [Candidatus Omnitrophica bacterium CG11_big_fil_rev_8_21_14_0_20_45_26]PIW65406.1 MAG: hypothetical protein COW12_02205 [Candidatus Omnitrophica bacterium CG12_big_fil_rev_8_21_14_0_65_45_16]
MTPDSKVYIFESVASRWQAGLIRWHKRFNREVWIVEPFHAFHHASGIRFYPQPISPAIRDLIDNRHIQVLTAKQLDPRQIYAIAADRAVGLVEKIYPYFSEQNRSLAHLSQMLLNSSEGEKIFRKFLCEQLGNFLSIDMVMERIQSNFHNRRVIFYPASSPWHWLFLRRLIRKGHEKTAELKGLSIAMSAWLWHFIFKLVKSITTAGKLVALCGINQLVRLMPPKDEPASARSFKYGVYVISPRRQLRIAQDIRGPQFLIDNRLIQRDEVVFISRSRLQPQQKAYLEGLGNATYYLPGKWQTVSHAFQSLSVLSLLKFHRTFQTRLVELILISIAEQYKWRTLFQKVRFDHLITHGDFGINHIARAVVLKEQRITSWYFVDSMNTLINFQDINGHLSGKHPFWTYLCYDHLLSWHEKLSEYFRSHPGSPQQIHLAGCLWADHILNRAAVAKKTTEPFKIAVFDTTYSQNSFTSYEEGIQFTKDIIRLADDFPQVQISFKEKRYRQIHPRLEPKLGPVLLKLYDQMAQHERIRVFSHETDSSELMDNCDLVISFPFTSTTFEAMSAKRPAFWHDPIGLYKSTPYAQIPQATTHGYEGLSTRVREILKQNQEGNIRCDYPASDWMDPFQDGRAIHRFRELLVKSHSAAPVTV